MTAAQAARKLDMSPSGRFATRPATRETSSLRVGSLFSLFLFALYLYELNIPRNVLNPSNVVLALTSLLIVAMGLQRRIYLKLDGPVFRPSLYLLLIFLCFCILSAAWSPVPVETAFQGSLLLLSALATAYFYKMPPELLAQKVVKVGVVLAALSFLIVAVVPSLAFQPSSSTGGLELRGVFFHQQRLGLFMAIAIGLLVIAAQNGDLTTGKGRLMSNRNWLSLGLLAAVLLASAARSYTVFLALSLAITLLAGKPGQLRFLSLTFMTLGTISVVVAWDQIFWLVNQSEVDLTLTGRTMVWDRTLGLVQQRSIYGWGFASFNADYFNSVWNLYRPPHAHNSYLQALFDTGVIGFVVMTASIVAMIVVGIRYSRSTGRYSFSLFLTTMTILCSTTGNFFGGKMTFAYGISVFMVILEAHQVLKIKRERAEHRVQGLAS